MDETADQGQLCRRLMRRQPHVVLATSLAEAPGGHPYASLVAVACGIDASPILLLSDLAQHSRNIAADRRVSLLFDGTGDPLPEALADPLAAPRVSLLGEAERADDPHLLARFVARHPSAASYAGFGDFHLYRVVIGRGHLVAGFGRISWVEPAALCFADDAGTLAVAEADIVAHMNADHADALSLYATRLLHRPTGQARGLEADGDGWRMTGIDPEGIDLRREQETARLDFIEPVLTPQDARRVLVALVEQARKAVAG
jgi:heme iron utilization protein